MSDDTPDNPKSPDCLLRSVSSSAAE